MFAEQANRRARVLSIHAYSPQERQRRSDLAKRLHREGKFGGRRRPRPSWSACAATASRATTSAGASARPRSVVTGSWRPSIRRRRTSSAAIATASLISSSMTARARGRVVSVSSKGRLGNGAGLGPALSAEGDLSPSSRWPQTSWRETRTRCATCSCTTGSPRDDARERRSRRRSGERHEL
jgi:hypothetical protein